MDYVKVMKYFNLNNAKIVTFSNSDFIKEDNYEIEVVPAYKYMLS